MSATVTPHLSSTTRAMDLTEYRGSLKEQARTSDLLSLIPKGGRRALDIGALDGHYTLLLAERFDEVIALDLTKPAIVHPKVTCVQGNAANLDFPDNSIDFVFCAEVLEHIPPTVLPTVCQELERVANGALLIGVPYKQDIRVARTTCRSCGGKNPPWGHVNSFDEQRLRSLFPRSVVKATTFVGQTADTTNALSMALMDLAGNPYGAFSQGQLCIHCGRTLTAAGDRTMTQKVLTKLAFITRYATNVFARPRSIWMHTLFVKQGA
jgi:SAM-dependent methyltransferase